jgi:hypothetical protein
LCFAREASLLILSKPKSAAWLDSPLTLESYKQLSEPLSIISFDSTFMFTIDLFEYVAFSRSMAAWVLEATKPRIRRKKFSGCSDGLAFNIAGVYETRRGSLPWEFTKK